MANQTVKDAVYIKGTNPQHLIEKIIRSRIYDCRYWKEECFALTSELLVDKAIELKSVGGVYGGNVKPSPFLCLVLKMLQIQPEKEIIIEFIRNEEFKYVRALGAFYMRLTGTSVDVYKYLEPLYIDYRKMKKMNKNSKYELIHMDEFIDELLHGDRVCDISLPRLQKRHVLEDLNELEPRISALDVNLDDAESSDSDDEKSAKSDYESGEEKDEKKSKKSHKNNEDNKKSKSLKSDEKEKPRRHKYTDYDNPNPDDEIKRYKKSPSPNKYSSSRHGRRRSRSKSRDEYRSNRRDNDRDRNRERERDRDRDRDRERDRDRDRVRDRSKDRRRDDSRHERSRRKHYSNSRSRSRTRSRSKDRRKEKSRRKNHSSSRSNSHSRSRTRSHS